VNAVKGLHHITAIAGPAQENLDFDAGILGMRLVKRSINQDDPGTYHRYTTMTGTSFAPTVTGLCALLLGVFPDRRSFELKTILKALSDQTPDTT
jgi:catechol 2,3-dioxygenase-like lactoylglutathione lyase family enzyme